MAITPQRVLHDYLLLALAELGGSASKRAALDWIDEHFGSTLTADDRRSQPTRDEPKWENQTAWERNRMVTAGLIEPFRAGESTRGVWTLTAHGRAAASPLGRMVSSTVKDDIASVNSAQGPLLDPVRRKKIEDAAQDRLMARYRADGWEVVDTRVGHPYDARAIKGEVVTYLEAKGTTTDGETVIVTRNEVAWAREHPGECVIGVWSGIEFDADDEVRPESGAFRVFDWAPMPDDLEPIEYDWRVG